MIAGNFPTIFSQASHEKLVTARLPAITIADLPFPGYTTPMDHSAPNHWLLQSKIQPPRPRLVQRLAQRAGGLWQKYAAGLCRYMIDAR